MDKYFLETNIFMYAAGKSHEFKEPCVSIISKVHTGKLTASIDTEVFQEVLYRYHHINLSDKGVDLAWSMMDIGLDVLPIIKKEIEISLYLYKIYQKKKSFSTGYNSCRHNDEKWN
jgi:predicted nucleic acid-binding protein